MPLQFRPHHFLCTLGFRGKGYSEVFVKNFAAIADRLKSSGGDSLQILVTGKTDSICAPCPNRKADNSELCESQVKIETLDRAHAEILGIRPGDTLTWGQAKERIAERMTLEKFEKACAPCSWKALGVCEESLVELKRSGGSR